MAAPEIDPEARPDRARAIKAGRTALGVVAVLLLVAATLWLAIGGDGSKGPPTVLTPPETADREAPREDERGGAEIAHQDRQVYEIVSREEAARRKAAMAAGEESPMEAPGDGDGAVTGDAGSVQLLPRNPDPERIDPPKMAVREPEPQPAPNLAADPTTALQPDPAPAVTAEEPQEQIVRVQEPDPAATTEAEPIANVTEQDQEPTRDLPPLPPRRPTELAALPPRDAPPPSAPAAAPQAAPEPEPARSTLPPESTFLVQLGAVRDKSTAQREWRRLRQRNADILGSLQLFIQEVNITGRGVFHRIQAGPLPDETLAELACGQLRSRNQACFVVAK